MQIRSLIVCLAAMGCLDSLALAEELSKLSEKAVIRGTGERPVLLGFTPTDNQLATFLSKGSELSFWNPDNGKLARAVKHGTSL
ncbi:MAG: hypothetical protein N2C14_12070, partial [Planctomycetales bacterium]